MAQPQVEKSLCIDSEKERVSEFVESVPKKKPGYAVIDLLETVTINSKDFGPKERFVRLTEDELWERLRDGYETRRSMSQLSARRPTKPSSESSVSRPGKSAVGTRMRSKSVDASFDSHFNQGALLGSFDNTQMAVTGLSTSFVRPKLMRSKNFCVNAETPDQQPKEEKVFLNFANACAPPPKYKLLQKRSRSYNDFKTLRDSLQNEQEAAEPLAVLSGAQAWKMPSVSVPGKHQKMRPIKSDSDVESLRLSRIAYPAEDFPDMSRQKETGVENNYQKLSGNLKPVHGMRGRHKYDQPTSTLGGYEAIEFLHRLGSSGSEDDVQLPKLSSSSKAVFGTSESEAYDYSGRDVPRGIISSKSKTQQTTKPKKRVTLFIPDEDSVFVQENPPRSIRQVRSAHAKLPEVDQQVGKAGFVDRMNDSGIETEMDNRMEDDDVCNLSDENEAAQLLKSRGRHSIKAGSGDRIMDWLAGLDESSQQYMRKQMAVLPEIDINED
ncbi:uncharacterized protein [Ptychodera flava]|uniref:uncharacterized protein n=1 Tax=Ptychodera flava TaxID=63121 RepID=UPI00396A2FE0